MMITLSHKKMEVWKFSISLVKEIYLITQEFPDNEKYGLTSQMRRAAISIPSNLSEGLSRTSSKEKARFIDISRSSLVELDTQMEIALLLGYCDKKKIENVSKLSNSVFGMLTSLLNKYQ